MDITLDKKGNTEASIKITLKEGDYQPKVEEKVGEYRKKAQLKGFRPGKAPIGLIKRMYGKSILVDEINHIISESLPKYIQEQNLKVLGEPLPNTQAEDIDWDAQKEFEFSYDIGFVEDFSYELSDKVKITHYEIEVSKKEVDEEIEYYKNRFGETDEPETIEEGDSIGGLLEQSATDQFPDGIKHDVYFKLEAAEGVSKDVIKKLTGLKKEDQATFDIRKLFPEDKQLSKALHKGAEEAKDINGEFTLTVNYITRQKPAEINQDFYDKLYGKDKITSEEEFRKKVEETLSENFGRETDYLLQRDIRKYYIDNIPIEMPNDFLKRWLLTTNEKLTQEEIEKEYAAFADEMKWDLIRNKIAKDHEVKVESQEIREAAITSIEAQFGQPGILAQFGEQGETILRNFLEKNYVQVFNQTQSQKVIDFIKEKINLEHKKVSLDEFKELIERSAAAVPERKN